MTPDQFRAVADHFPQAALLLTKEGAVLAANRAVSALGWSSDRVAGMTLADLTTSTAADVREYLRLCSRSREPVLGALRVVVEGRKAECRCYGKLVLHDPHGGSSLLLVRLALKESTSSEFAILNQKIEALHEEIRRRRHVEERLREQSEWLAVTLSSIGDGVITTDGEGNATFLNPVAEELTGWTSEQAHGRSLTQVFRIVNEDTREVVENPVFKVLESGTVVGLANHTILISREGTEVPIDDSGAPIRNEDGEVAGVVLIFRDVTERKRTEDQLRLANRRKDEFLAMLAHELRNPLAPIRSGLDLLALCDADPEIVEPMQRQVEHLVRLVDDLLDVARIMRGQVLLKKAPAELSSILKRAAETIRDQISARGQMLSVRTPSNEILIHGDEVRLTQVVANLLQNASKYNVDGGSISVTADVEGRDVIVSVKDSGIGIEPDLLPHVFDLFTQAARSIDRAQGGLGIGLTVVKSVVELHGGTVSVQSDGLGRGAVFSVRLPSIAAAVTPSDSYEVEEQTRRRILVVDDNVAAATMLAKLFHKIGRHEVVVANDGPAALEAARKRRPELVLLDIGLPGMDGYAVAREMRRLPDAARTLIVALTGYGSESDRIAALDAGCDEHLVKPPALKELARLLEHPKLL